ncbi:MAG: hypothetical protein EP343_19430 [Deltaproteobacteria bacterium]|nr:MAG: hypothetical protein EP343_19430 [Deltaproteobacteria bacterium]
MNSRSFVTSMIVGVCLVGLSLSQVWAAGNYLPGNGASAIGKGTAVIATGSGLDATQHNPANLGKLRGFGLKFDSLLSFQRASFLRAPEGNFQFERVSKDGAPAYIPALQIWYTFKNLGPGNLTLALYGYGPHGKTNFRYPEVEGTCVKSKNGDANVCNPMPEPGPQRLTIINTSSPLIFFGFASAYEWNIQEDTALRFGGTLRFAYISAQQRQSAIAASLFYSANTSKITDGEVIMDLRGSGVTVTGDIGVSMTLPFGLAFGASLLFPMHANLNGDLDLQINTTFDSLASIQGKGVIAELDFPFVLRAGLGWQKYGFSIEASFVAEFWTIQEQISVKPQDVKLKFGTTESTIPDFAIEQKFRNSYSFRIGAEYLIKGWVYVRAGYMYEMGATQTNRLSANTLDYPDKHIFAGGIGVKIPGGIQLDVSVMHALEGNFDITNSETLPINVSPPDLAGGTVTTVGNGNYQYGVTVVNIGISGNWLK